MMPFRHPMASRNDVILKPSPSWSFIVLLFITALFPESFGISPSIRSPLVTEYRWGAWTQYSTCTRSCGIGIKIRQRACYKYGVPPEPADVIFCGGISTDAKTCNTQACPAGSRDFRSLQCSFFNGKKHGGRHYHDWIPYRAATYNSFSKIGPCALACTPLGLGNFVVQFASQVVDGTECGESPRGVCVAGRCADLGCDNQLYSKAKRDWCGVCRGDNSSCETISGNILENITVGYQELLVIPKGARHIHIMDRDGTDITLALQDNQGNTFIDGYQETRYSTITRLVAGTVFYYHHPLDGRGLESFQAEGPITQELIVMGHTKSPVKVVHLQFEYTMDKEIEVSYSNSTVSYPERSLPWEAILYDKLHPGYNIGAIGKAYVKRKKPNNGKYFRFRFPPWQPPEPILPIQTYAVEPRLAKQTIRPIWRESVDQHTRSILSRGIFSDPSPSRRYSTVPFHSKTTLRHHKGSVASKTPSNYDDVTRFQNTTSSNASMAEKSSVPNFLMNISSTFLPSENTQSTSSYENDTLKQTTAKIPITDEVPVFIPEKSEEDQSFEMTEDLLANVFEKYKSSNSSTGEEDWRDVDDVFGKHREKSESQAFSEPDDFSRIHSYTDEKEEPEGFSDPRYQWQPKKITPCSSTCAPGGVQFEFFECFRVTDGLVVSERYCDVRRKPEPRYHKCTRHQCVARWVTGIWSHCSRSCGEGQSFRSVRCWRMLAPGFDSTVHADQCKDFHKPKATMKCNEGACGPQWHYSSWGKCSANCGLGYQLRTVRCNTGNVQDCQNAPRPSQRRTCGSTACVNRWETSSWASCSGPCGIGIKQRRVFCRGPTGRSLDQKSCDPKTKPLSIHGCGDKEYCPFVWVPQRWGQCSAECGEGIADRKVVCGAVSHGKFQLHPDSYCQRMVKPISTARCRELPCKPKWLTTDWSKCSKSCGRGGVKMREVRCYFGNEESNGCDVSKEPKHSEECPLPSCPKQKKEDTCLDDKKRINCELVVKVQLCEHWYYKTACCKSCKDTVNGDKGRA